MLNEGPPFSFRFKTTNTMVTTLDQSFLDICHLYKLSAYGLPIQAFYLTHFQLGVRYQKEKIAAICFFAHL